MGLLGGRGIGYGGIAAAPVAIAPAPVAIAHAPVAIAHAPVAVARPSVDYYVSIFCRLKQSKYKPKYEGKRMENFWRSMTGHSLIVDTAFHAPC